MSAVTSIHEGSNPTHETVNSWLLVMAERGEVATNTARMRISALTALVGVLADDEPRDPEWLLDNLDAIAKRWALKNAARGDTTTTYAGRARTALADYIAWKTDPAKFKFRTREPSAEPRKRKPPTASPENPIDYTAVPEALPPSRERRTFPLGGGRVIAFELPEGMTVKDARRFAAHLLTFCDDFDPSGSGFSSTTAMVHDE